MTSSVERHSTLTTRSSIGVLITLLGYDERACHQRFCFDLIEWEGSYASINLVFAPRSFFLSPPARITGRMYKCEQWYVYVFRLTGPQRCANACVCVCREVLWGYSWGDYHVKRLAEAPSLFVASHLPSPRFSLILSLHHRLFSRFFLVLSDLEE